MDSGVGGAGVHVWGHYTQFIGGQTEHGHRKIHACYLDPQRPSSLFLVHRAHQDRALSKLDVCIKLCLEAAFPLSCLLVFLGVWEMSPINTVLGLTPPHPTQHWCDDGAG